MEQSFYPEEINAQTYYEKYIEEWHDLWSEWEKIASEIEDEEGNYVNQDHHWEAPYFDPYAVVEDIEKIATKMLPDMEIVYSLNYYDDNEFVEAVEELNHNIHSLPEWFGADQESCCLGVNTTKCVLQWEWLAAQAKKQNAVFFIKRIMEIADNLKIFLLNDDAIIEYFLSLPEDICRKIYEDMKVNGTKPPWKKQFRQSQSKWHIIYHNFSQLFDTD